MYLYPNMPNRISPESQYMAELDRSPEWIAEVKKNGWRLLVEQEGNRLTLWTRKKTIVTACLLEVRQTMLALPDCLLDGEYLNPKRIKDFPESIVLFDVILCKGDRVYEMPFAKRRGILERLYKDYLSSCPQIALSEIVHIGKKKLYYESIENENEGIVLKKLDSQYKASDIACQDNPYWIKVKRVEAHVRA